MIDIGLVQINNSFSGQNYLPYSVALLEAYVKGKAKDDRYKFRLPIYKRNPIRACVERLQGCDVVGFSTYVWNGRISLEIARRLEGALVIFGGPHVPDDPSEFLLANPQVDVVVHNEGEATFLELLEAYPSRDWAHIKGISYARRGVVVRNPPRPRFRDLDEVPSPFLTGAFDELMRANPDEHWIGLWETNRGCPFRCSMCDWGSNLAAKMGKFGTDRVLREVDWFAEHKVEYLFCCDANYGSQKRDIEIAEYVAKRKLETGYPVAMSVQNTKNSTERAYATQKILSDAGLNKGVALSMQSVDADTLAAIKRDNISLDMYMELQRRFARDGVETYSDLIIGLPGETYNSFVNGVDLLISLGQHNRIQFNNLSILPNAEMGNKEYQRKWGIEIIESEIINIHGERVALDDDVPEVQELVVSTASCSREDWAKTRAFAWMTAFLHFDKILQIPLVLAHELGALSYKELVLAFMDAGSPLLKEIADFFRDEARRIQTGAAEYVYSADYLGIYWPADEYMFIKLAVEEKIDQFYEEAYDLIHSLGEVPYLRDAVELNHAMLKQPFPRRDVTLYMSADIMGFYESVRRGEKIELAIRPSAIHVQRETFSWQSINDWCREVVWWGNKKGAYLYGTQPVTRQLAGHF